MALFGGREWPRPVRAEAALDGQARPLVIRRVAVARLRRIGLELVRALSYPLLVAATFTLCIVAVGVGQHDGVGGVPAAALILCCGCGVPVLAAAAMGGILARLTSARVRALMRARGRAARRLHRAEQRRDALKLRAAAGREPGPGEDASATDVRNQAMRRAEAAVARHEERARARRLRYENGCEAKRLFRSRRSYTWFLATIASAMLMTGAVLDLKAAGVGLPGPTHQAPRLLALGSLGMLLACGAGVGAVLRSLHQGGMLSVAPWDRSHPPAYRRAQTFQHEVPVNSPVIIVLFVVAVVALFGGYASVVTGAHSAKDRLSFVGIALTFFAGLSAYHALLGAAALSAVDDWWRDLRMPQRQLKWTKATRTAARFAVRSLRLIGVGSSGATLALLALMTLEGPWYQHQYVHSALLALLVGAVYVALASLVNDWREPTTDDMNRIDVFFEKLSDPVFRNPLLTMSLVLFLAGSVCELVGVLS
jgi:hypothetical protein